MSEEFVRRWKIWDNVVLMLAPSAPPQMVEAVAVNTSSVRVTWRPPPERQRNGAITGYRVMYASEWARPQDSSSDPPRDVTTVMMTGSDHSCVIAGLATWTVYRIWVSAFTRAGEGPHSDMIVVQTDEGGTFSTWTRNHSSKMCTVSCIG